MKKSRIFLLLLIIPLFFSSCEKYIFCKKGDGEIIHQERTLKNFSQIDFGIPGKLVITQSDVYSVEVVASQNLVNEIKTEVIGAKLKIRTDGCIKTDDSLYVFVSVPVLTELNVLGAGSIVQEGDWNFEGLSLIIEGTGTINLSGFVCDGNIENRILGTGSIALKNFLVSSIDNTIIGTGDIIMINADSCTSSVSEIIGSGDISLSSNDTLETNNITISGDGDLHFFEVYSKNVDVKISGTGSAYVSVLDNLDVNIIGGGNVHYIGNPQMNIDISGTGHIINDN
ncbi:MAG: DUF2807 domain-containing protein [Bacteroidota bacterium]|nr:DUF2807 domain-containing protein [Bacteroidota bacterium]